MCSCLAPKHRNCVDEDKAMMLGVFDEAAMMSLHSLFSTEWHRTKRRNVLTGSPVYTNTPRFAIIVMSLDDAAYRKALPNESSRREKVCSYRHQDGKRGQATSNLRWTDLLYYWNISALTSPFRESRILVGLLRGSKSFLYPTHVNLVRQEMPCYRAPRHVERPASFFSSFLLSACSCQFTRSTRSISSPTTHSRAGTLWRKFFIQLGVFFFFSFWHVTFARYLELTFCIKSGPYCRDGVRRNRGSIYSVSE